MCARSFGPESGGSGTTGTPASRPPTTAATVSAVGRASTASAGAPATRSATAVAAPSSCSRESATPSIRRASALSPCPS